MPRRKRITRRLFFERLERRRLLAVVQEIYREDFEADDGGYLADNLGGTFPGLWHYSIGRSADGQANHSRIHNWYYGAFESSIGGGRYDIAPFDHQGTLTSPAIQLPNCGTLALNFNYLLDTRPELDRDFVSVSVIDGTTITPILSRQDGSLPETDHQWRNLAKDLTAFAGREISLLFSFRTGDPPPLDPEGWYIDDVVITQTGDQCEPPAAADLSITKTDNPDPVVAGTDLRYTLTVASSGPSAAENVTLSDTLPAGTTFVSLVCPPGWTTTTPAVGQTGMVTATLPTLPASSGPQACTLVVHVGASVPGGTVLSNTATVASNTPDPTPSNNSDTEPTSVNAQADLAIIKVDDTGEVVAGSNLTYTLTITNSGPSDSQNVSVSDTLPSGTTFVSFICPPAWTTTTPAVGQTGTVTATLPTLPAGSDPQVCTLVVNVGVSVPYGTELFNTATVTSTTPDPTPGNNSDTEPTNVIDVQADLAITKTDSSDPVVAGTSLTYTLAVTTAGPGDAEDVSVSDTLPSGTTFVSFVCPPGWTTTTPAVGQSGTVTATRPTLPSGSDPQVCTLVVNVGTNVADGTVLSNTATVTSTTPDPNSDNNSDTETTNVVAQADLVIVKADDPSEVVAGNNLTYTLTVTNNGPSDAQNVTVSDALPSGTTFVSFVCPPGWTTTTPAAGQTGTVTATRPTLSAGNEPQACTLVVRVGASVPNDTVLSNTATVASDTIDPTPDNNSDTEPTNVIAQADLAITKGDDPNPVVAGANLTYTLTVTTIGPSDAQNVSVSDTLPAGTTFVSFVCPPGWTTTTPAAGQTGTVTATRPTLPAGSDPQVCILVISVGAGVPNDTVLSNTATVASDTTDPTPENNSDTEPTNVIAQADLAITKTDDPNPAVAGNNLTYSLTVTTLGPSDAQSVSVSDTLPVGTTFFSFVCPPGWTTTAPAAGQSGTVTATRPTLAAGSDPQVCTLVVNVGAAVPDGTVLSNTATVTSATPDPTPGNNSDTEPTNVLATEVQTVQFITPTSLFRNAGPFTPPAPVGTVPTPPSDRGAIKGYLWHDLDQDGVWDAGEPGRPGWRVFLDDGPGRPPGDNIFDPESDPVAVTASDGSYLFTNLVPGTYTIREDRAGRSDGTFQVQQFPASDPTGARDPDEHRVVLAAGQIIEGDFGVAEIPNFGAFEYSPLVRPADNARAICRAAIGPAADIYRGQPPLADFRSVEHDRTPAADHHRQQTDRHFAHRFGRRVCHHLPANSRGKPLNSRVPARRSRRRHGRFFAFYDPAIRAGDQVIAQFPDWYDNPGTTGTNESQSRPPHTFAPNDRLEAITAFTDDDPGAGPLFTVKLVGGSTFDGDIFYDSTPNRLDLARLSDLLASPQPKQEGVSNTIFEPTSDMNARHPDGANGVLNTQSWPIAGPPPREIGYGDFGVLNVEFARVRAPWLDLDADNSSGAKGVDFTVQFSGSPVRISDVDAAWANFSELRLQQVALEITNRSDGTAESLELGTLPSGITATLTNGVLTVTPNTIPSYRQALAAIRYRNDAATPTPGTRAIRITSTGTADFQSVFNQTSGNLAIANVVVVSTPPATPEGEPEGESSPAANEVTYSFSPARCHVSNTRAADAAAGESHNGQPHAIGPEQPAYQPLLPDEYGLSPQSCSNLTLAEWLLLPRADLRATVLALAQGEIEELDHLLAQLGDGIRLDAILGLE